MKLTHRRFLHELEEPAGYHCATAAMPRRPLLPTLLLVLLPVAMSLAGCMAASDPRGDAAVAAGAARVGIGDATAPPIAQLPSPLARSTALAFAYAHSPRARSLRATALASAAAVDAATRLPNPTIDIARLARPGSSDTELTRAIAIELAAVLLWPEARSRAALADARANHEGTSAALALARDVELAWLTAVAAEQTAVMAEDARALAEERAELARRYRAAGNLEEGATAVTAATAARAAIAAQEAHVAALHARRDLADLLGASVDVSWRVAAPWPDDANAPLDVDALVATATQARDDLRAAEAHAAERAAAWRTSRRWAWLGLFGIGYEHERTSGEGSLRGPTLYFELPLFDRGYARRLAAEAAWQQASVERDDLQVRIGNEVRALASEVEARRRIVAIHDKALQPALATHYARAREQANFMLHDVFALLDVRAEQADAAQERVLAERDAALALTRLRYAVGGSLPSTVRHDESPQTPTAEQAP